VREIPDEPFPGWDPPPYRVDDRGKVIGAEPGPHNNWGRFGDLDQIGTANHLTPERVAAAAALVQTGKRFSLALPIGPPTPGGYRSEPLHFYGMAAGDGILDRELVEIEDGRDFEQLAGARLVQPEPDEAIVLTGGGQGGGVVRPLAVLALAIYVDAAVDQSRPGPRAGRGGVWTDG